jgi:stage IV sporulation protein FB
LRVGLVAYNSLHRPRRLRVFLLEPTETPYDLNFSLFRIPVRVNWTFWLVSAVLGWDTLRMGTQYLLGWVVLVFISVLIHEMGHVCMGMVFGAYGRIVLYSFGGLAVGSNRLASRGQRILVLLAGPLAGFLFTAVALAAQELRAPGLGRYYLSVIVGMFGLPAEAIHAIRGDQNNLPDLSHFEHFLMVELCWINVAWGVLNLFPIWPLDGGQICREVLEGISPRHGTVWALTISAGVAAIIAVNSLLATNNKPHLPYLPAGGMWSVLMFGLLAYQSIVMLQRIQAERRWHDDHWS